MIPSELTAYREKLLAAKAFPDELVASAWAHQVNANPVLRRFAGEWDAQTPLSLPIEAFKHHPVISGEAEWQTVFESSRTTGAAPSQHYVKDLNWYREVSIRGFRHFFPEKNYRILALLPSYLERGNSSLVYMVKDWMGEFGLPGSGFFLHNLTELRQQALEARQQGIPVLLIGVAFALLDLAELGPGPFAADTLVIETGGMKGRGKELTRMELHERLRAGLGVNEIRSEYGMTELLSQAYTGPDGRFRCAPTMKVWVSDIHLDELVQPFGVSGRLHVIDLANIDSCCFIATDDMARLYPDGSFEVLGRLDTAEIRGCNLMYV